MAMILNRNEIVDELTELLMQFDKDMHNYQTDVYMYIDDETHTARLTTFENVGGNSWLNDDHTTIYADKEHYDGISAYFTEWSEYANALGMDCNDLAEEARVYHEYDDIDDIGYCEIEKYVFSRDDYAEKVMQAYYDAIDDSRSDYAESAETIISEFIDDDGNVLTDDN